MNENDDFTNDSLERIISAKPAHENEVNQEVSLRPAFLGEYVGQSKIKDNLSLFMKAAKQRGDSLDHVLLAGPPGLGKTTLAHIIAHEMDHKFIRLQDLILKKREI